MAAGLATPHPCRLVSLPAFAKQAVSGSLDGTVMVWNFAQNRTTSGAFRFIGHGGAVHSVAYDPTNNLIASASADRSVRLWRPTAEGRSTVLRAHTATVRCCAFSQSGRLLATASDDKTVKLSGGVSIDSGAS